MLEQEKALRCKLSFSAISLSGGPMLGAWSANRLCDNADHPKGQLVYGCCPRYRDSGIPSLWWFREGVSLCDHFLHPVPLIEK